MTDIKNNNKIKFAELVQQNSYKILCNQKSCEELKQNLFLKNTNQLKLSKK